MTTIQKIDGKFIAVVKGYDAEKGRLLLEQRNHFAAGEELEIVSPGAPPRKWKPEHLYDEEGGVISAAPHAQMRVAADCAEAYLPAAAWLVMDWLKDGRGVTAFSAGDMTVRMDSTQGRLEQQALRLMAPWLKDKNFVFRGVMG